jgi:ketopantoate hydroxymethyltransferase
VKQYAGVGVTVTQAARRFAEEVRERKFPDDEHSYR